MHKITKSFDFCYGHRVYTQKVVPKYSGSTECPCHRLHGHQGKITIEMETESLDDRGFVIDFKELNFVKDIVGFLDHRFILSKEDPNFKILTHQDVDDAKFNKISVLGTTIAETINLNNIDDELKSHLQSFIVVSFNPTSEGLAKWIYDIVDHIIADSPFNCSISSVTWSETPKTSAIYRG